MKVVVKLVNRDEKHSAMLEKFDLLKQYYHNCKHRKVMERLKKTEFTKLHSKYNDNFTLLKTWSNKGPDINLLTRMQNAFNNYQNADQINRTTMLPTIHQLGAQIQQRVQQCRQQQYQTLYITYKPTIDEMATFNTTRGNKYISKIQKQMIRWRDMKITGRNKQLNEIEKTHVAMKQEILKIKSKPAAGNEIKEEDDNENDDDDNDHDNDNNDTDSKEKQKDSNKSSNQSNSAQSQSNTNTNDNSQGGTTNTGSSTTGN